MKEVRLDAMIMAGGRSLRMRRRGDATHKALIPLAGIPMVERSLRSLIAHDFRSIGISISEAEPAVLDFARSQLEPLAAASGARVTCIVEMKPLGTIGAVRCVAMAADSLLVVNVDNVSDLDLRRFVEEHRSSGAAMTIASHREPFVVPFGELDICDGAVVAYREKPSYSICVSSGTYVLSPDAVAAIEPNESISVPELFDRLHHRSLLVAAYRHEAAWIDVNDEAALARAELFVRGRDELMVSDGVH